MGDFTTRRRFLTAAAVSLGGCQTTPHRPGRVAWKNLTITRGAHESTPETIDPDRFRPIGRTVDMVGPRSEWRTGAGMRAVPDDGSATPASPTPYVGERSLFVEGESGVPVVAEFDTPVDFRDAHLSVAIYPDKPESTDPFPAELYAPDAENRVICLGNLHGYFDCGWRRYDFSVNNIVGDPDLSAVRYISLDVGDRDEYTRCWIDDVRAVPKPDRGKVMFMFDDIAASAFTNGFRILDEHGHRGSYGVITDIVGEDGRMTVDQLNEAERAGWDLVSHSKTGERMTALESSVQREYLATAKEWLQEHALDSAGAEHFVFPLAKYGRTSLANVYDFHEMAYIGGRGSAPAVTDPLTIARRPGNRELQKLRRWVRAAARHRNLLALVFHTIDGDGVGSFRRLAEFVARMVERDRVDVITPTELSELQAEFE